ncbi:MAG: (2Fe-2S) ferredoxin domain-containing protein [Rhodospirillales bacterium]|nr:(2Fe-2S) ferredoxin domain-containing protein [Rhodospirillales bacterium]
MSFYRQHVFFCSQTRPPGHPKGSCAERGAADIGKRLWEKVDEAQLEGVRVSSAGCLGRCDAGPVIVIYPEGVWYGVKTVEDVDTVVSKHLVEGGRAEDLLLP